MSSGPEEVRRAAAAARIWFDALPPVPQAFALLGLPRRGVVDVQIGALATAMTREGARNLILSGPVRILPAGASTPTGWGERPAVVAIHPASGFPVIVESSIAWGARP